MIDGIKIYSKKSDFTGNFDNCMPDEDNDGVLRLINPDERNSHYMTIKETRYGSITIKGSLRKWQYGPTTLKDLNEKSFAKSLRKLAKALNMPYKDLLKGKITRCEIGLNVITHEPIANINQRILKYKHVEKKDYKRKHQTLYFNLNDKCIKIYDKMSEITHRIEDKEKRIKKKNSFFKFISHGYNFLRLELCLFDQRSFDRQHLGHISTLEDLLNHYQELYPLWVTEMNNLMIFSNPIITKEMKDKEITMAKDINEIGFIDTFEKYCTDIANSNKSDNAKRIEKSRTYEAMRSLIEKYGSKDEYNKAQFRKDIARTLIKIGRDDAQVNLSFLFRLLWRKPN